MSRMRTVGVDLAAGAEGTGLCMVDWENGTGRAFYVIRGLEDDDLMTRMDTGDWIGIDVPLGWPEAFIEAVVAHRAGARWPSVDGYPIGSRQPYCYRMTDLIVRDVLKEEGVRPLSVSADKLGATAMRGALLLSRFNTERRTIDRIGSRGGLVEVYPAAALARWGLAHKGYKGGTSKRENRAEIIAGLRSECPSLDIGPVEEEVLASDDALDALISALVARAAAIGATHLPPAEVLQSARREGWIHLPEANSLSRLGFSL